jgi:cellulose synthase/poly-beta-1,6-N-acetylglucosamine synthase-like glycosyltransferase
VTINRADEVIRTDLWADMFIILLNTLAVAIAAISAVPVLVFAVQVLAGSWAPSNRSRPNPKAESGSKRLSIVAALVPAHNESAGLRPTLLALKKELQPQDRLIVIADNCADDTAEQAHSLGAEVLVRVDTALRGKGYALDHGWQHLRNSDKLPDYILIVDADCVTHPGAVAALVRMADGGSRPVQARYLCTNGAAPSIKLKVSEFAWLVKNWIRPLGYFRLGLPCQLAGSGMLFPRACLESHTLASGHLVEDLQLGLALAVDDMAPLYCENALVTSYFPTDVSALQSQRKRWEHGHLAMIGQTLPGLVRQWFSRPRSSVAALALDLAVPPLTLLLFTQTVVLLFSGIVYLLNGSSLPFFVSGISIILLTSSILLAWRCHGRSILGIKDIAGGIIYMIGKLPIYAQYVFARQTEWVRTKRDDR